MHYVYIIFSESVQKFYIGESEDTTERLTKHNSGAYSNAFTRQAKDWNLQVAIECPNRTIALKIEKHIKSMKSQVYIANLIKYSELREKLINRFNK
jgi:putative endonuclease